jgi:hypothetical protein
MRQLKLILVGVASLAMCLPARVDGVEKLAPRIANRVPQKELVKYVPKPIPCGPEAPTAWRIRQEESLPFFKKLVIDPFMASKEASQPWAPLVLKELENLCVALAEIRLLENNGTWARANDLAKKGCTYPAIRWMQAMELNSGSNESGALQVLQELDGRLANMPNPWFAKVLVGIGYLTIDPSPKTESLFAERITEWVQKGGLTRKDSREVSRVLSALDCQVNPTVLAAFEKAPSIDPWLTLMLRGRIATDEAFDILGSGSPETMTAEKRKVFSQHVEVARLAFEEAWRLHPEFPHSATLMIGIAFCSRKEEMRMWFDRAIAAEIDGPMPYVYYIKYSRPRMGGTVEEITAFAESCYQTQRHDTSIPLFYATIMFQIAEDLKCDLHEVFKRPGVREKCVEVLAAQAKNTKNVKAVQNLAAGLLPVVEYTGGDLKKALEYNQPRKMTLSKSTRGFLPDDFNHICAVLNGLQGQNAKSLIEAEELYRVGRYEEALAALTAIRDAGKLGFEEEQYLFYRISCLEMETRFKRGEWIAPTLEKRCPGWFNIDMGWRGAEKGLRTDKDMCQLEWMTPLPVDVEYEGVFRFIAPTGQASRACFQLDKFRNNDNPSINFSYANNRCQVVIGDRYAQPDEESVSIVCEKPEVRFRIVSCKNKVSVWVNEKQLIQEQDISKSMQFGRKNGMRHLTLYGTRVVISDLRMRSPDMNAVKK